MSPRVHSALRVQFAQELSGPSVWYIFIGDRWEVEFGHSMVPPLPWNWKRLQNLTH